MHIGIIPDGNRPFLYDPKKDIERSCNDNHQ